MTYNNCNSNNCSQGCKPANYDCSFSIDGSPYDPTLWIVTMNGMSHKVRIPKLPSEPSDLSTNYSNSTLDLKVGENRSTVSGSQLGDIVKMGDLRDVVFDPTETGTCFELVYRKYADCGEGCQSPENSWSGFNVNSTGAKQDYMTYVRGTNAYGCPEYLDKPTTTTEYWFAGWKTDGEHKQFGYFQPTSGAIPTDSSDQNIVLSQNTSTKKPVYGPLKISEGSLFSDGITSSITPANGFSRESGSITFYPHIKLAKINLDFLCSSARSAQTVQDLIIGTIDNASIWPSANYFDLPVHWIWNNNSDGGITPIAIRFNVSGQVLISGYIPARTTSGKASYILTGVDDIISWEVS